MTVRLLSVNVGLPQQIGVLDGAPVISGFIKTPLATETVAVGTVQIDGDGQADLSVHGGVDKAVYCYPADHWPWWEREQKLPCSPGTFGENLTIEGCDETNVAIGDRFRWGDVLLEVSEPRAPCYKFAMCTGRPDTPSAMTLSGRTGWYFRVIRAGHAPVRFGGLEREESCGGPTVRDAFQAAMNPRTPAETLRLVVEAPGLAQNWRRAVAKRMTT